jgi:hypothetical protein
MTLHESFRPTGPLSGYLTFLTKRLLGVSRTIGITLPLAGSPSSPPPPFSCSSYTYIMSCVILYIPTLTRRFLAGGGSPLFPRHPLYIQYICGCLPPSPLSSQYKPFPYSLPSPFIVYCGTMALRTGCRSQQSIPVHLKTPLGTLMTICRWLCGCNT